MALEFIGTSGTKKVYLTPYAKWRLGLRNLSSSEVLQTLKRRDVTYPKDEDGRQKIRTNLGSKRAFLVIQEEKDNIIIITGGES